MTPAFFKLGESHVINVSHIVRIECLPEHTKIYLTNDIVIIEKKTIAYYNVLSFIESYEYMV
jgi:uncharacterized protein YlzI (FlbEa/FlbD family)